MTGEVEGTDADDSLDAPSYEAVGAVAVEAATKTVLDKVALYVQMGASTTQAVDMYAVDDAGVSAAGWARETEREPSSVRQSTRRGRDAVYSSDDE